MSELIVIAIVLLPFLAMSALLVEAIWGWGADDTAWMDTFRPSGFAWPRGVQEEDVPRFVLDLADRRA